MTPQEQTFALKVARGDGSEEATRVAYCEAFDVPANSNVQRIAAAADRLLSKADVALEVEAQRAAARVEREKAQQNLHASGIDAEVAKGRMLAKAYALAEALLDGMLTTVPKSAAEHERVDPSAVKALELIFRATGVIGVEGGTTVNVGRVGAEQAADISQRLATLLAGRANIA